MAVDHPCPWTRIIRRYLKDTAGDTQILTLAVGASLDVKAEAQKAGGRLLEKRAELADLVGQAPTHCDGTEAK